MPARKIIIPIAVIALYAATASFLYINPGVNISTILACNSYKVTVTRCGCFGCDTAILKVNNNKATYHSFKKSNPSTNAFERTIKTIAWNTEKQLKLKQLFIAGIKHKNYCYCSVDAKYILSEAVFSASFVDDDCSNKNPLEAIIEE